MRTAKTNTKDDIEFDIVINKDLYKIKYIMICNCAIIKIILILESFLSKRNLAKIISKNIWLKFSCDILRCIK